MRLQPAAFALLGNLAFAALFIGRNSFIFLDHLRVLAIALLDTMALPLSTPNGRAGSTTSCRLCVVHAVMLTTTLLTPTKVIVYGANNTTRRLRLVQVLRDFLFARFTRRYTAPCSVQLTHT